MDEYDFKKDLKIILVFNDMITKKITSGLNYLPIVDIIYLYFRVLQYIRVITTLYFIISIPVIRDYRNKLHTTINLILAPKMYYQNWNGSLLKFPVSLLLKIKIPITSK